MMLLSLLLFAAPVGADVGAPVAACPRGTAQATCEQALHLLSRGAAAEAVAALMQAIQADPRQPVLWQVLAACRMRLGEPSQAAAALQHALQLPHAAADMRLDLALAREAAHDDPAALAAWRAAAQALPHLPAAQLGLAMALLRAGQVDDAASALRQAGDPDGPGVAMVAGALAMARGDWSPAQHHFHRACTAADLPAAPACHNAGVVALRLRQPAVAAVYFAAAQRLQPNLWQAAHNEAVAQAQQGNMAAAQQRWRALCPSHPAACFDLALSAEQGGAMDVAAAWRQSVAVQPADAASLWHLGMALDARGSIGAARQVYASALRQDATPLAHLGRRAAALLAQGQNDQAVAVARRMLARAPTQPQALKVLAEAAARLHDDVSAADAAQRLVRAWPDEASSYALQARVLAAAQRYDDAAQALQWGLLREPGNTGLAVALGQTWLLAGDTERAQQAFSAALRRGGDGAAAYLGLAARARVLRDAPLEASLLQRALSAEPEAYEASRAMGLFLLRQNQAQAALPLLQRAGDSRPDDAAASTALAHAYARLGDHHACIVALQRALAANPRHVEAHYLLGLTYMRTGFDDGAVTAFRAVRTLQPGYALSNQYLRTLLHRHD